MANIKFCKNCYDHRNSLRASISPKHATFYSGFTVCFYQEKLDGVTKCPMCGKDGLIDSGITESDLDIIGVISDYNRQLLDAMLELRKSDIIEYELKMSQFRTQYEKLQSARCSKNIPKEIFCPKCGQKVSSDYKYCPTCGNDISNTILELSKIEERKSKEDSQRIHSNNKNYASQTNNKPHCPYCQSTNIKKITATSRIGSSIMFGVASKKIGKQWHCNNCGSDF